MEQISTDTDAGIESAVGIGKSTFIKQSINAAQPNWLQDGYGIRGPQRQQAPQDVARAEPMQFGIPSGRRGGDGGSSGPCQPVAPPDDTDVYVWGTVAGTCQWIPICDTPCAE